MFKEVFMKYIMVSILVLLVMTGATIFVFGLGQGDSDYPDRPEKSTMKPEELRTAVFAGGCFWGIEGVYERVNGVWEAASGYAGGSKESAHYDLVSSGTTEDGGIWCSPFTVSHPG